MNMQNDDNFVQDDSPYSLCNSPYFREIHFLECVKNRLLDI